MAWVFVAKTCQNQARLRIDHLFYAYMITYFVSRKKTEKKNVAAPYSKPHGRVLAILFSFVVQRRSAGFVSK